MDLVSSLNGGFPCDWIVNAVSEDLKCSICFEVLNDPHQCKNGHCFCKTCLFSSLLKRKACPNCNVAIALENVNSALFVKNFVSNQLVKCSVITNSDCPWSCLSDLPLHVNNSCG